MSLLPLCGSVLCLSPCTLSSLHLLGQLVFCRLEGLLQSLPLALQQLYMAVSHRHVELLKSSVRSQVVQVNHLNLAPAPQLAQQLVGNVEAPVTLRHDGFLTIVLAQGFCVCHNDSLQ